MFWKGADPLLVAFIFVVCPLCMIFGVRWFIGLPKRRRPVRASGDYLVPGAFAVVGVILGPVG